MERSLGIVPFALGALTVVQVGLNRKIGDHWGLPSAVLLNALIVSVVGCAFVAYSLAYPSAPGGLLRVSPQWTRFAPWMLAPGLIGFAVLVGAPWSVARWGATYTFVLLLSAQLAAGLLWDWQIDRVRIPPGRIVGVLLTLVGVVLATRRSS